VVSFKCKAGRRTVVRPQAAKAFGKTWSSYPEAAEIARTDPPAPAKGMGPGQRQDAIRMTPCLNRGNRLVRIFSPWAERPEKGGDKPETHPWKR